MRTGFLLGMVLLLACGDGEGPPPATVGSGASPKANEVLLGENKLIAQREELDIDGWVQRQGLVMDRTGTGVRIKVLHDSTGVNAKPGQVARIRFAVSLINGRQCYASSAGQPEEFTIGEDNVESGLHEAVQHLSVGDSAIIVIPSHRAHGLVGDQDKIPMRSTVIYHLGLVGLR